MLGFFFFLLSFLVHFWDSHLPLFLFHVCLSHLYLYFTNCFSYVFMLGVMVLFFSYFLCVSMSLISVSSHFLFSCFFAALVILRRTICRLFNFSFSYICSSYLVVTVTIPLFVICLFLSYICCSYLFVVVMVLFFLLYHLSTLSFCLLRVCSLSL